MNRPSHIVRSEPLYTARHMRAVRDEDRRFYRGWTIALVVFQIAVLGPIRLMIDIMLASPKLPVIALAKPYVVPGMIVLVVMIWVVGIATVFKRRA